MLAERWKTLYDVLRTVTKNIKIQVCGVAWAEIAPFSISEYIIPNFQLTQWGKVKIMRQFFTYPNERTWPQLMTEIIVIVEKFKCTYIRSRINDHKERIYRRRREKLKLLIKLKKYHSEKIWHYAKNAIILGMTNIRVDPE